MGKGDSTLQVITLVEKLPVVKFHTWDDGLVSVGKITEAESEWQRA
jgi:hypothetical protein